MDELKNNRLHTNKLYYTRQDYSKNEKKLKRSKQQLDNVKKTSFFANKKSSPLTMKHFECTANELWSKAGWCPTISNINDYVHNGRSALNCSLSDNCSHARYRAVRTRVKARFEFSSSVFSV